MSELLNMPLNKNDPEMRIALPRLFHGTSLRRLPGILQNGLVSSEQLGLSNYAEMRPRTSFVYLASYRAFKYAATTAAVDFLDLKASGYLCKRDIVLIEIDVKSLDQSFLRPDDDLYSELVGPIPSDPHGSRIAVDWANQHPEFIIESLNLFGTVAYKSSISPSSFLKIGILRERFNCALYQAVEAHSLAESKSEWLGIKATLEAITLAIMGEGICIDNLLSLEDKLSLGQDPAWFQAWLDSATVDVYFPDGNGNWVNELCVK